MNDIVVNERNARWAAFDADWYQRQHPELAAQMAAAGITDVNEFYIKVGQSLRHAPNPFFDEAWYVATYQDVAEQVAAGIFSSGFEHYTAAGHVDRSPHWLFSDRYYLLGNTDVTRTRLDEAGLINGYAHYLANGDREFRSGHLFFDPKLYAAARPGENLADGPFADFVRDDCKAGSSVKLSAYFDPVWYLQTYPQVAADIAAGVWVCALQHYLYNKTPREFDPNPYFLESFYTSVHVDIIAPLEAGQFRNGFDHFIQFGVFEARKPHPEIDLAAYFRAVSVQADIHNGMYRDVFAHYVRSLAQQIPPDAHGEINELTSKALFAARARSLRPLFARQPIDFTPAGPPVISVIVVMFNQLDLTLNALDSLRRCYAGSIDLILVDSGSADESRNVERYVRGAKLVRFSYNVGFVEACNAALANVAAPVTLFMNNDLLLERGAIAAMLNRLATADNIGAVGGKIIRTNGRLQEAGCIIWRDGATEGYLRDGDPNMPEANFVRDVDFCSGVFLGVRSDVLKSLGGFDATFKPAYFEETDLCIRLHQGGYRVVYDPAIMVVHQEYSSGDPAIANAMMAQNQPKFRKKNLEYLRTKYPRNRDLLAHARSPKGGGNRILFIEDRIPLRHLGSGFTRSNDIIRTMAALGHQVSVFPIYQPIESLLDILVDFPDTVEVIYDRELKDLAEFIKDRSGYFDVLWIARTHNAERLIDILMAASAHLPINNIVLDTEAVAAPRLVGREILQGREPALSLEKSVQQELASAYFCQKIVAVNERDADIIRQAGFKDVSILGHVQTIAPTPKPFAERQDMLFMGAIHDQESPNLDGLEWFVNKVLPLLNGRLPDEVGFTIAGYVNRRIDMSVFGRARRVRLRGPVENLAEVYNNHRIFVAPTRYAGGIPFKLHEAAAFGLPIVASTLLCQQVGWRGDVELLAASVTDPDEFATQIVKLYTDQVLWTQLRQTALARLAVENSPQFYEQRLATILKEVCT
ncbi:MAG: glycosyltransferase [Acidocella sp.]|nr:glycosyltransferase [Acidocella sp.]